MDADGRRVWLWHGRGAWKAGRTPDACNRHHACVPNLCEEDAASVRLWRNTLVRWRHVDAQRQQLERVTTAVREEVTVERRGRPARPCRREALRAEVVAEMWACRECGRVTRIPAHADAHGLQHYALCSEAWWRPCAPTSRDLGFAVEFCDGVDARWWRCGECRRTHSEAEVNKKKARHGHPWHTPRCPYRESKAQGYRARELEGQQVLF